MRNQVIKTAQGSSRIETSGYFGEQAKTYYEMLASGGIGLLIVESCSVEYPLGVYHPPVQFHLDDDKYQPVKRLRQTALRQQTSLTLNSGIC